MPPYIESIHVQESIRHWVVDIIGPPNTSYAGAIFQLDIEYVPACLYEYIVHPHIRCIRSTGLVWNTLTKLRK